MNHHYRKYYGEEYYKLTCGVSLYGCDARTIPQFVNHLQMF